MVQKDFLLDFDLYICERFGYRNSLHVTQTMNGFCVDVNIKPRKTLHPFLGVQQWRGRFSRLVHHPCALQLCQKTGTGIAGTCAVLQGVCATIWVQVYRD